MTLHIKNMVCPRCIEAVRHTLLQAGFRVEAVRLGEADIVGGLDAGQKERVATLLAPLGFELLEDRKSRIIEAMKNCLVSLVRAQAVVPDAKLSDYLSAKMGYDYKYLSNLFSETQGRTVENYFTALKIERVKELLVYDELTLSEIAFRLGFSSVAHLSARFKRVTGLTPSRYKRTGGNKRRPIDEL